MIDLQKMVILRSKLLVCCRVALLIGYENWLLTFINYLVVLGMMLFFGNDTFWQTSITG